MAGISGAFLLLPFQFSVLGFTSPAVSSTNLVYNIIGIPSGVYNYIKDKKMAWPLVWVIISGTIPGILAGVIIRVYYLPDKHRFQIFAGAVLLYLAIKLVFDLMKNISKKEHNSKNLKYINTKEEIKKLKKNNSKKANIQTIEFSISKYSFKFNNIKYTFNPIVLFCITLIIGIVAGIYGVGGGAFIAPLLVAIFGLPVYVIAGACLLGTFFSSIVGILIFYIIFLVDPVSNAHITPDWLLGSFFGIGGFLGMYFGAKVQKYIPALFIKALLACCILFLSIKYLSSLLT